MIFYKKEKRKKKGFLDFINKNEDLNNKSET